MLQPKKIIKNKFYPKNLIKRKKEKFKFSKMHESK